MDVSYALGGNVPAESRPTRTLIARAFGAVEDLVYIGLGLLLAGSAVALLVATGIHFGRSVLSGDLSAQIIPLLDRILLILLVVELLYTCLLYTSPSPRDRT